MKKLTLFALILLALIFIGRQVLVPKMVERGFADPKRSGPCIGVLAGKTAFVFDAGTNGSQNLGPMGFPLGGAEEIFLTHLHSDHLDGLGQMLLGTWINSGRTAPTPVSGPIGTAQVVEGFNMAYQTAHTERPTTAPRLLIQPHSARRLGKLICRVDRRSFIIKTALRSRHLTSLMRPFTRPLAIVSITKAVQSPFLAIPLMIQILPPRLKM